MQAIPTKSNAVSQYLDTHKGARLGLYAAAVFLGGTVLLAAFRVFRKYNTPQNKRKRNVSKNKVQTGTPPTWYVTMSTDCAICQLSVSGWHN